jgi:hypothetical protein
MGEWNGGWQGGRGVNVAEVAIERWLRQQWARQVYPMVEEKEKEALGNQVPVPGVPC